MGDVMFIYGHLRSTISIFSFFRFLALPGHPLIAGGRRRTVLEEGEAGGEGATVRAKDIPRWPRIRIGGGRIKNCTENSIYLSLFLYFSAVCASRPATRRPSAARVAAGTPLKWYIDDEELDEGGNGQKNETDSKKWDAISIVETTFKKVSGNIFSSRQFENKLIFTY
jgi:hypothetical protein